MKKANRYFYVSGVRQTATFLAFFVLIGLLVFSLGDPAFSQKQKEKPQERILAQEWEKSTGEKLRSFLPAPLPALTDRMPWDSLDFNKPGAGAGSGGQAVPAYLPMGAEQSWRFADPTLVQQYEKIKEVEKESMNEAMEYQKQTDAQKKERQKKLDPLTNRYAELLVQGKYEEAEKVRKEMDKLVAENDKEGQKFQEIHGRADKMKKAIEAKSRSLEVRIIANRDYPSKGTNYQPAGTIKGQALYRRGDGEVFDLLVFMGPPGFRNDRLPGKATQLAIKSILVEITTRSTTENMKADEIVARQMLEKIDFAGLAGMMKR